MHGLCGVWGRAEKDASFCTQGELFIDSTSSGDVIQGSLGDCWFLGTHKAHTKHIHRAHTDREHTKHTHKPAVRRRAKEDTGA